jgi:hypothetical protein
MPWLLEPMAELSELRFGAAVTSEAETEPYESVPLNVESTYVVCIEGGAAAQGFASGMQWIFFPGTRLSDHSVPSAAAADGPVDNESLELEGLGGDPSFASSSSESRLAGVQCYLNLMMRPEGVQVVQVCRTRNRSKRTDTAQRTGTGYSVPEGKVTWLLGRALHGSAVSGR